MKDLRVSFPKPCSEQWGAMRPAGCNRFCERCEKTIHDLSKLTIEEAEVLACAGGEICVRAEVGSDGLVRLRRGESGNARRMLAIGASVGLLAASAQASAAEEPRLGAIKGEVAGSCGGSISATAADGRVYYGKVGINGRYKVKRLPAGSYQVRLGDVNTQFPGEIRTNGEINVEAGRTSVLNLNNPNCIVIGMIEIDHGQT